MNGELSAWATVYATEPEKTAEFSYNHNGLRTQKKVTTKTVVNNAEQTTVETTDYTLHGKLITHLTKRTVVNGGAPTTEEMHFFYDAQSRSAMVEFGGAMYTYRHNLQGDIIGIVDNTGRLVVRYGYDAWGKPTEVWSEDSEMLAASLITAYATLAALNPFRYRGYVWDAEIGLYYLRSRYYNPGWGRFINVDDVLISSLEIGEHNVCAYCKNAVTVKADDNGTTDTYIVGIRLYVPTGDNKWIGHVELIIYGELLVGGTKFTNPIFSYGYKGITIFNEVNRDEGYSQGSADLYEATFTTDAKNVRTMLLNIGKSVGNRKALPGRPLAGKNMEYSASANPCYAQTLKWCNDLEIPYLQTIRDHAYALESDKGQKNYLLVCPRAFIELPYLQRSGAGGEEYADASPKVLFLKIKSYA